MRTRTVQLGGVCEFIRGVTFDKAEATTRPQVGKTPILRAGNIGEELDAQNDLVWVPDGRVSDVQLLRQNDIAICMSSGSPEVVGKTARVAANLHASVGSFCGIIRPRQRDEASYLSFYFRSPGFRKHRNAIARGANIQNLRFSQFEGIELEIPPDQQRIAGQLEQADRLRRTRRYALELTDSFLPAAFLQLFSDPGANPKGFNTERLEEHISLLGGFAFQSSSFTKHGIPLIRIGNANKDDMDVSELVFLPDNMAEDLERFLIHPGDLLITLTGTVGKDDYGNLCVVSDHFPRWFLNQRVAKVVFRSQRILPTFLLHALRTPRVKAQLLRQDRGVRQANLSNDDVYGLDFMIPPLPLQQKFAALVERAERLRSVQRESLRQAEHLFQSLLQLAFSL